MSEVKGAVNLNSGEMALGSAGTLFDSGTTFNANGGTLNLIQAVKNDASRINLGALNLASNLNIKTSVDLQNETMPMITAESVSGGGVIMVSSILLENEHDREISVVPFTTNTDLIDRVSTSVTKIAQPINIYDVSYESGNFIFTKAKGVNPSIQSSNVASQAAQIAQMGNFTHLFATLASRSHLSLKNDHEADEGDMWIRPYYSNEILKLDNLPKIKSTTYGALFGVDSQAFEYGDVGAIYTVYGGYNGGELRYNGDFENSNVKIRQNGGFVGGSVS